ncbi:TPA: lytic transglycosylase domain-containing protein, partial [Escherichia coli]
MERKNANIDDVIRTVETASAKELEELAGIREAVEDLKGGRVATVDPVSRSVSALNHTIENSRPDFVAKAPSVDPIVDAMKRLNLGDVSRVVQEDVAQQEQRAKSTTPNGKKRRRKAIPEDVKAQRTEAAEHAREMFGQKGGAQKSQNQRDARGRFIGKSGSKAAAEDARAERAEKARRKEDDERLNAESGLLKKLSKVAEGIGNPSETRAVDALGYAVAGPLWAAGKELGGISKEVGGSLNGARKSIADVIRGNDDNSRRKGFFRRKSQNSADVVQVNTQKRTVQELQDQTSEIKEGNDKILSALDQIAKNTGKKKGG